MSKLNSFQIKIFMALLMVLDHLPHIHGLLPPLWVGVFHVITRCVGVWFAYAAVEGYQYTRSKLKYNGRLFFWAAIMMLGNFILSLMGIDVYNNIFLTFAVGILILNIMFTEISYPENFNSKNILSLKIFRLVLGIVLIVFGAFMTEGGVVMLPFMLLTYIFRKNMKKKVIAYVLFSALLFYISYVPYPSIEMTMRMLMENSDFMFITVLPFIFMYNGKRGMNNKFSKYFFYVFYPAHLWIIGLVGYFY